MGTVRIQSTQSSPATTFYLEADIAETDTVNRRWRLRFYLRASNGPGGSTASQYGGSGVQAGRYNNIEFGRHSGNPFLPGGYANGAQRWHDGPWDVWLPANAAGYWTGTSTSLPLAMHLVYGSVSTSPTGSIAIPRMGTIPPAPSPTPGTPDQITATTMRYQFNSTGDGGNTIIRWEYQWSTSPTFASGNSALFTSTGTSIVTGLPPTTTIYLRSRGVNSVGNGVWSAITSGTTLAASAPGMLVTPALDGNSATVALTPPPDMPSPSGYRLEYRIGASGTVTGIDVVSSPIVVSPLSPGVIYQWRSAAKSGTYTGPFTAWTPVAQPNTNTNPGDYFDGSTAARVDLSFGWLGTANNSMSRAIGKSVLGWGAFNTGNAISGGSGVVYRATGGRSQGFSARVDFWTPTTAAGFHAGTAYLAGSTFEALQGATYDALIHVRLPTRSQSLAAMIVWLDAAGVEVGRTVGPASNVSASGTVWTPLRAAGSPVFGATQGAVRVIDVAGPGWSLWNSGDTIFLDDAITPFSLYYFDGNTPNSAEWDYQWEGAENASISRGVPSTAGAVNPLIDPDCPPVPAPPRPPEIEDSCVEEDTTEWRRFWQDIPAIYVPTWVDTVPTLQIKTTTAVRLVRVRYYPNPFGRMLTDLEYDSFCSEQIISFIPGETIFTLDGVAQRAFAEVSGSSEILTADNLLRGDSNLWPSLGCGIGYYVTVDVPTDTPTNALTLGYSLRQRY